MKAMTITKTLIAVLAAAAVGQTAAHAAAGKAKHPEHQHWHFNGPFGTFDKDALQRGYQVYETVCSNCHSLNLVAFRNLGQKGGPFYLEKCPEGFPETINCANPNDNPVVKALAAKYKFQVTDGPDDTGDMFQREPLPSDRIPAPYANEQLARMANNNALPPDLSLMAKARHGGADYIYSLLTGYEDPPSTVEIGAGQYYNPYFHGDMAQAMKPEYMHDGHPVEGVTVPLGGVLAMAPPLADGIIEYGDDSPQTVEQYAKDVTEFLMWAAEPKMESRKALGVMSIIYLVILAGILYWSYRKIWADQH
ncbi:cytochrome c1 [Hyphococcus sp.]|jgi:ubiquinol-cytochrome c reductase cytochrome c1 subunit|uniref:cytochrome c1 n=1 Tax=Hyphococcus sp. TaxID=2038636 RepID=UPI003D13B195